MTVRYFLIFTILKLFILCFCSNKPSVVFEELSLDIIPEPNKLNLYDGCLEVNRNSLQFESSDHGLNSLVKKWQVALNLQTENSKNSTKVQFEFSPEFPQEGYSLSTSVDGILVKAKTEAGLHYGLQSLTQILDSSTSIFICIPFFEIIDEPRFSYRGMHLDVCRHFFSVDFIKKYIDLLAYHKFNTFHWHLTEDQGWRIEIKKYPKLTEIGAWRKETLVGHYNDQPHQFDNTRYGGYYTQEQIKDIVRYAGERYISVIPEIELPGHAQAALAAYPELGCIDKDFEVMTKWGISENVFCPRDETFDFLKDVLDEVVDLFESKYIHIGGDECPKTQWEESDFCKNLMLEKKIKDTHELQSYFIGRIERHINSKGKSIIGWDEILEGGLAPNATVMSWRGTEGAIEAANANHNVIMTPTSHCYFDYYQSEDNEEPLAIGGYLPLEVVYNYEPIPESLDVTKHKYILGAQGNIWTEYMKTEDQVEYMSFPRACAMAELNWSTKEKKDYKNFINKLDTHFKRLDNLEVNYADHRSEIVAEILNSNGIINVNFRCANEEAEIKYWTNTDTAKTLFSKGLQLKEANELHFAAFKDSKQSSKIYKKDLVNHFGTKATYKLSSPANEKFGRLGSGVLMNGVQANPEKFGDKEWLGFNNEGTTIEIDLNVIKEVSKVKIPFFNAPAYWIHLPSKVVVSSSADSKIWTVDYEKQYRNDNIKQVDLNLNLENRNVRYLRIELQNTIKIPQGFEGAGNTPWFFIGEVEIN